MGDRERVGGREHRIKELKAPLSAYPEIRLQLIIFCFNMLQKHANGLSLSHSHHTAESKMGPKERKCF